MLFPFLQKNYDVVVVGAGPAGSAAAKYAARGGADVLVIDRKKEIGSPVQCAGFLPNASEIENLIPGLVLPEDLKKIPPACILAETSKQRIYSPDLQVKEFDVNGFVLDRRLFDTALAEQAAAEGAQLLCGTAVKSVRSDSDKHTLHLNSVFGQAEITAKVIIGADGPSSLIGKTFGLCRGAETVKSGNAGISSPVLNAGYERGVGFEYKMTGVDIDSKSLEMFFGNEYVPGGYIWIFPEGDGKANVGIGLRHSLLTEKRSARDYLNHFIREHPIAAEKLKGGKITSVIAGVIPADGAPEKTATDSVMVAGDAAGHVMATNGGGIPFAVTAGKIAGEVAAEAVSDEKCGRKLSTAAYEQLWRGEFGEALESSVQARKLMDKFFTSDKRMNAAFKFLPADKFKEMQCGNIPHAVKIGLDLLLK
ncbi:MAG: geranylgeranyl reductase family protein [Methanosarcinales archaeon]|jgi:digeranylgeranylglycerophospholipid reductase|nr:geranylgeranyl reductase family protein [Methanosarcinales archaeon]